MAKKGMARPEWSKASPNNTLQVPELQGKAKHGKEKANPIITGTGTEGPSMKVFHERPISSAYSTIDTDLARDNLENDIPSADLEDL